jgi:hypothetical protein
MNKILFLVLLFAISGCSGPSDEEVKDSAAACVNFYKEKRADGNHVEYLSHWMKNNKLVISLAEKKYESASSYSKGLCVVDLKEGTIELPSIFNQDKWEK